MKLRRNRSESATAAPVGARRGTAGPASDKRWKRHQHAARRWALWGAGLGLLAGTVLAAPAQWMADAVGRVTDGRLLLAEARGSIWNGSALPVLTGGPGSRDAAALTDRLHWRLRPAWTGLRLHLQQDCCLVGEPQIAFKFNWGGFTVTLGAAAAGDAKAAPAPLGHWPASWLAGLGTPWNTLQLGGTLQLISPGLTWQSVRGRMLFDGALVLEMLDVSSRLSPLPVLGSYRVGLEGRAAAGDAALLRLDTLAGPLRLTGSGQLTDTGLRFRGDAQAAAGEESALANLLNIIGRRQGALSVISIG